MSNDHLHNVPPLKHTPLPPSPPPRQVSFEEFKSHYNFIIDATRMAQREWTARVRAAGGGLLFGEASAFPASRRRDHSHAYEYTRMHMHTHTRPQSIRIRVRIIPSQVAERRRQSMLSTAEASLSLNRK